jgi:D-3-phosphoglycerate dehydrogenase
VVGTGGIGKALVAMLGPLGPRMIAVNRSGRSLEGAERTVTLDALRRVIGEADFLVLAAPVTEATRRLVGRELLSRMRSEAWVVNVSRGALVDTGALVDALREGRIGGAALDVTDPEPLPDGHPLWSFDDVLITPHVANTWEMALPELAAQVRRNVERFIRGDPLEGLVDPALGY